MSPEALRCRGELSTVLVEWTLAVIMSSASPEAAKSLWRFL